MYQLNRSNLPPLNERIRLFFPDDTNPEVYNASITHVYESGIAVLFVGDNKPYFYANNEIHLIHVLQDGEEAGQPKDYVLYCLGALAATEEKDIDCGAIEILGENSWSSDEAIPDIASKALAYIKELEDKLASIKKVLE